MIKIIVMTALIFLGMVGYDNIKGDEKPVGNVQQQEEKASQHEKKAAMSIFMMFLPPKEEWPDPMQKFYIAFNMDEVIDPIRQKPEYVPIANMSRDLPAALVAIEDHDFYNHGAIAVEGIMRAAFVNMTSGEIVQGGSTLTQQFVKNVFLTHEQTMERKIEEAVLSLMLEEDYTKEEILELYLNTTYFGAGAYGVSQATRTYFGKAPSAVTLAEAAVIAALPYAPSALNPLENPIECKKRQLLVLSAMRKYNLINEDQLNEARSEKIELMNGMTM